MLPRFSYRFGVSVFFLLQTMYGFAFAQTAGFCSGFGDCFIPHPNPGCNNTDCCARVCSDDPDCCVFEWDSLCVNEAKLFCDTSTCPGVGSCFSNHGTPGCDDANCCNLVCGDEPLCCELDWDSTCVNTARDLCTSGPCGSGGNCFSEHPDPGCDLESCCSAVCDQLPSCCQSAWSASCVQAASQQCGSTFCPGVGSCTSVHAGLGCEDELCCNLVCSADPDCCLFGWDTLCVGRAVEECGPSCPQGELTWLSPLAGAVDARQPHPITNSALPQGIDRITVRGPIGIDRGCWSLCEAPLPAGNPNGITNVLVDFVDNHIYTILLVHPLSPGATTKITYTSSGSPAQSASFRSHPGNVNGQGNSSTADVFSLFACLLDQSPVTIQTSCPWGLLSLDVDRNGGAHPADALRIIDLFNRADAFSTPWLNTPLPPNCPN
ncbi:MAG: hypothetical protein AABZ47_01235 [Planctomycetota bacterium]